VWLADYALVCILCCTVLCVPCVLCGLDQSGHCPIQVCGQGGGGATPHPPSGVLLARGGSAAEDRVLAYAVVHLCGVQA
jgi:hypothetical protein